MWTITDSQLALLRTSHSFAVQVHCVTADGTFKGTADVIGGSIDAHVQQQQLRDATLELDQSYLDAGLFNQYTDLAFVIADFGTFTVPLFTGRVNDVQRDDSAGQQGHVTVHCVDRGADLVRAQFEQPWNVDSGIVFTSALQALIVDVDPSFALNVDAYPFPPLILSDKPLTYETNRGQALDEIAAGVGAVWYPTRIGNFATTPNPFAQTTQPPSALTLDDTLGDVFTMTDQTTRQDIRNSVTVVVERTDNTDPVRVTVRDADPSSPTQWGTTFGKQNLIVKLQSPAEQSDAETYAQLRLRQGVGLTHTMTIDTPLWTVLDPFDVVTVRYRNVVTCQVIQQVTYPLGNGTGRVTTREWRQVVGDEQ
jgi:hypothetical protein